MSIARKIHILGHVQGVFFREWTVQTATSLGVTGWVRNRSDGSVETLAIGEPALLERFIEQLHGGPPSSRIDEVNVEDGEIESLNTFQRRSTI